jgi:hypothetical protein
MPRHLLVRNWRRTTPVVSPPPAHATHPISDTESVNTDARPHHNACAITSHHLPFGAHTQAILQTLPVEWVETDMGCLDEHLTLAESGHRVRVDQLPRRLPLQRYSGQQGPMRRRFVVRPDCGRVRQRCQSEGHPLLNIGLWRREERRLVRDWTPIVASSGWICVGLRWSCSVVVLCTLERFLPLYAGDDQGQTVDASNPAPKQVANGAGSNTAIPRRAKDSDTSAVAADGSGRIAQVVTQREADWYSCSVTRQGRSTMLAVTAAMATYSRHDNKMSF